MRAPRLTLKLRMALSVVLVLAVTMTALVWAIASRSSASARESGLRTAELTATGEAAQAQDTLDGALRTTRTLAAALTALHDTGGTRAQADALLQRVLADNPGLVGTWTGWEPDAFDGRDAEHAGTSGHDATGRYVPYWYRTGAGIALTPLTGYDEAGAGDYYLIARTTGEEKVLEPYAYEVDGQEVFMTSVAVPVVVDGETLGVAGVDLPLTALQEQVSAMRPYGTGRALLVSTAGAVVAGGAGESAGQVAPAGVAALVRSAVDGGRPVDRSTTDAGRDVVQVAVPVALGAADTWAMVVTVPTDTVLADARSLRVLSAGLALAALLVAAVASYLVARSVLRPVEVLRERMAEIADGDGDLTRRVAQNDTDEVGQLGAAFNRFADKVCSTIRGIAASADSLGDAADDLTAVAGDLRDGAASTSAGMSAVSGAMGQVNAGIQGLAAGATEMSASIEEIASNAARSAGVAEEAVSVADTAGRQIAQLDEASAGIGSVVQLITSIAEQTNLLALNATIEAARAGEMGKGFAVVAGEVKELAQQTARATEDITRRISAIQAGTSGASEAIGRIQEVVRQISDYSTSIAGAVEEQSATTAEMTRTSVEAAAGGDSVVARVGQVAAAAETTEAAAGTTQAGAARLRELAGELNSLVGRFRV
ncbi:methyl-accepting chemotaxis protein [Kineococcus glutinatus]|uniref:Methyl-accepting chemotaxis protein n=1 Tax=Kineococcus glutinatus TaxID=1070872 RepID=A0ABP9HYQ5_9ACTN